MSGSTTATATLSVTGAVTTPLVLTDATLASNYTPVTVTADGVTYTGAAVYSIISAAGFTYSTSAKNGQLLDYLQLTGASGSQVVLSEGEVDPSFGGAASTDIIAYAANGTAIAPDLIVPGDVNGGVGGRDISGVVNLQVATATVPSSAVTSASPAPLVLSGALSAAQNPYGEAQIQALGTIVQKDTFLQGTTPKTDSFTGVPLLTVLTSAGLTSDIIDSYIVAAGSDGYGVVYSGGEIDPTYRAGATALLAYDDGTGTFPSVGGVSGSLRTTAPFDSKGGRYVSSLDSLSVANAGPSASIANYAPVLSVYNPLTSSAVITILEALTPGGTTPYGSVSPDGSSFAAAIANAANIAVVSAPAAGSTIALPGGYQAALLQGSTAATLADDTVGNALLVANQGNDAVVGFMGSDTVVAGGGSDTLYGTATGDALIANTGTNDLVLGAGSETATTQSSSNVIYLGSGSAQIYSTAADTIIGGTGSATVFASQGAAVFTGAGSMTIANGNSASTVVGGSGVVTLYGGSGGGVGFAAAAGGSVLIGGSGAATLVGAAGGDELYAGGAASDLLIAGAGNETLFGLGSTGADGYVAGSGSDLIFTGAGASTVVAGTGSSTIVAGAGADVFSFINGRAGGTETVFGFEIGIDVISLNQYATPAVTSTTQSGGATILGLSDGTRIILESVAGLSAGSVV